MVEPITKPTPAKPVAKQTAVGVDEGGAGPRRARPCDRGQSKVDALEFERGRRSVRRRHRCRSNHGLRRLLLIRSISAQMVSLIYNELEAETGRRRGKVDHAVRDPA